MECTSSEDREHQELVDMVYGALNLETQMARLYLSEVLRLAKVFDRKQLDYGSQNISQFGEKGVLVRVTDKIERLKNLLWNKKGAAPANEALADTWDDIHVYACIGRLCHDDKWV
jgi:hypothetical protein